MASTLARMSFVATAVRDDLGHQRRVVGGDVVADELGHVGEAHDAAVELHPLVHLAELDVADHVVDGLEEALGLQAGGDRGLPVHDRAAGHEAGQERPVVLRPVDQRVRGVAVGGDRGHPDRAVLVGDVVRLGDAAGAGGGGMGVRLVDVGHGQRDVLDAVAVLGDVVRAGRAGVHRPGDQEPRGAADQDVLGVVAVTVLRPAVRHAGHPERGGVVVGRLLGVAHQELQVVDALDGEDVAGLGRLRHRLRHPPRVTQN
jgi:hypothetical protein